MSDEMTEEYTNCSMTEKYSIVLKTPDECTSWHFNWLIKKNGKIFFEI
jgi:hypothetical protein